MLRLFTLLLAGLLCFPPALAAQPGSGRAGPPVLRLPAQDNARLLQRELAARQPGRPRTFAVSLPVHATPATDGKWTALPDGRARWQLRISSPEAKSLNLGFHKFRLPDGAELYLSTPAQRYGPFTAADNEDHNQFWSPVLPGDALLLEVVVPEARQAQVELQLATVNHDFEGVLNALSGNCNVDVACGAADDLPMVDNYRDVIRSVAAYTLNGRNQCTGFLINNTDRNGRPFFLTAAHCGVNADNAPSVVTYWNYQNSTCRTPGTPASGSRGDGALETFNTGARLRASYAVTDFALLELEEPVNPLAEAYFAGWTLDATPPAEGALTVHHPNVEEKRISFSYVPLARSDISGQLTPNGRFLRVASWDVGTTEGGSSGAPLVDLDGRVRGQLFGGRASCNNAADDVFGSLLASWTGGGTPDTRLQDWLDPCGTGALTTNGLAQAELPFLLRADATCLTRCTRDSTAFRLSLGKGFPADSRVRISADSSLRLTVPESVAGGSTFALTYTGTTEATAGTYPISVEITGAGIADEVTLTLTLLDRAPEPVRPATPAAGAAEIDPFAGLSWRALPGALSYDLQLALTPEFSSRAVDLTGLVDTAFHLSYPLNGGTTYYWRVRAYNACGAGTWSPVRSFATKEASCAVQQSIVLPVEIPFADSVRIVAELEVTEPVELSTLEVVVGIEHSFVGDMYASLIAPDGTQIPLFRPLQNGLCPGRDLFVVFSDLAPTTAEEFQGSCDDGQAGQYIPVQPVEPFAALIGTAARGTWQLVVTDRVPLDGGQITEFSLRFCAEGGDTRDLSVGLASPGIVACANAGGTAVLQLGEGFQHPTLAVEADGQPLDNFTYAPDSLTNSLTVTFSAWTLVGGGDHTLSFLVTDADGSVRRAVSTLTVFPLPTAVVPLPATVDSTAITFRWTRSEPATSYIVEVAETEDFSVPLVALFAEETSLTLPRGDLPELFSWRVVSRNSCGSFPGPARSIALDTATAVRRMPPVRLVLDVYPNPTYGTLHVALPGTPGTVSLSASLHSATGQRVQEWSQLRGPQMDLTLVPLPPGIYFLRLRGPAGEATRRILLLGR